MYLFSLISSPAAGPATGLAGLFLPPAAGLAAGLEDLVLSPGVLSASGLADLVLSPGVLSAGGLEDLVLSPGDLSASGLEDLVLSPGVLSAAGLTDLLLSPSPFPAPGLAELFLPPSALSAPGLTGLFPGCLAGTFSIVVVFQGANLQLFTGFLPDLFRTFADRENYHDMALIKSISGIRGTIGGNPGESLTPPDLVKFASAYGTWLRRRGRGPLKVVTGRDARVSGEMVASLVNASLRSVGIDVIDTGLVTTPTVEMAVTGLKAGGGIIFTASHNPAQWNALKLLNEDGEFLSDSDGREVLAIAEATDFEYVTYDRLGGLTTDYGWTERHIQSVIEMPLVDRDAIHKAGFIVAVDAVNSVGGIAVPALLRALGVMKVIELYCEPTGLFPHNPEPLPEHLEEISRVVVDHGADLGFVVDPDVDRLAIICEDGSMFGEEYTLVSVADYVLGHRKGSTVSNLSSTKALRDITEGHGCTYSSAPVGEVNVVAEMKRTGAVIGGEGNGGVIYPALHYGRDALAGIALFLTHLAKKNVTCSALRRQYPDYYIAKTKIELTGSADMNKLCTMLMREYPAAACDTRDGIKLDFPTGWVQIRKSNTEPVIRIYAEERQREMAEKLAADVTVIVKKL